MSCNLKQIMRAAKNCLMTLHELKDAKKRLGLTWAALAKKAGVDARWLRVAVHRGWNGDGNLRWKVEEVLVGKPKKPKAFLPFELELDSEGKWRYR